jgi:hypothetical protein
VWIPKHDEWLEPYCRMIERAVSMMDREDDFVATLAYVSSTLMPSDLRATPVAPATALFALRRTIAARLEEWLARRPRHSADSPPDRLSLAGADQIVYSSALRRVVGAWMPPWLSGPTTTSSGTSLRIDEDNENGTSCARAGPFFGSIYIAALGLRALRSGTTMQTG